MASKISQKISIRSRHGPRFIAGFNLDHIIRLIIVPCPKETNPKKRKFIAVLYNVGSGIREAWFDKRHKEYYEFMAYIKSQKIGKLSKSFDDMRNYMETNRE
jgi:hypothetical protein